ncbi:MULTISPECIES: hypothetical protein [unclassified Streptomyces]|uniref:hypothetical protein n=1 Tax=unclassified Streptomyces TaxID=2593676 RepID=UPI0022593AD9|nr:MULTISPECIES: hypothetical protein [unclassified Streptomyces]MCX4885838.1 hypothetical protein [Streptomyces sp. NBC_00847]MCX5425713.1 hypothetical protein [Streptomyces sp. NBC_00078]
MSDTQTGDREGAAVPTATAELLEGVRRHRRHTLELLTVCSIALVPWTVLLALTLPSGYRVHHWRAVWVGFDVLLLVAMASTAILGWLRHRAVMVSALATAVLLVCDAWFDVSLSFGTSEVWPSAALAVFGELPLAFYLIHRVMGMISLARWPSAETATDNHEQPIGPDV